MTTQHTTVTPELTLFTAEPEDEPELWQIYLDGAAQRYSAYDIGVLLEEILHAAAHSRTFFVLAKLRGQFVGGMRAHAALPGGQLPLVDELEGFLPAEAVRAALAARSPAIHCGGLWIRRGTVNSGPIARVLIEQDVVLARRVGARFIVGTAAEHIIGRFEQMGNYVDPTLPAFPFPDDRYLTRLIWKDV